MALGVRLHALLVLLAVVIGSTAFASTDDLGLSVLLSASIGFSALVAAALLLLRLPGGGPLVVAAAVSVIAVQFIDLNALAAVGWLRIYYISVSGLALTAAAADAIVQRLAVGHGTARGRSTRAWREHR